MSRDSEGNSFSPLADWSLTTYIPESTWHGRVMCFEDSLTEELKQEGYTEEDIYKGDDGQKAVVLWPTN